MTRSVLAALAALAMPRAGGAQRLPPQTVALFDVAPCSGDPPPEVWLRELEFELRAQRLLPVLPTPEHAQIRGEHRLTARGMRCERGSYELSSTPRVQEDFVAVTVDLSTVSPEDRPRIAALRLAELSRQQRLRRNEIDAVRAWPRRADPPPDTSAPTELAVLLPLRGSLSSCVVQVEGSGEAAIPVWRSLRVTVALGGGGCVAQSDSRARVGGIFRGALGADALAVTRPGWRLRVGGRVEFAGTFVTAPLGAMMAAPTMDLTLTTELAVPVSPRASFIARLSLGYTALGAEVAVTGASQRTLTFGTVAQLTTIAGPFASVSVGWSFGLRASDR